MIKMRGNRPARAAMILVDGEEHAVGWSAVVTTLVRGAFEPGAPFRKPWGIAADPEGNLFVSDFEDRCIRKVLPSGEVVTFIGASRQLPSSGLEDYEIPVVVSDEAGTLFFVDLQQNRIGCIDTRTGKVSILAEEGKAGFGGIAPQGISPIACILDKAGNLLVSDGGHHRLLRVTPEGIITTVVGREPGQDGDGGLRFPGAVAQDAHGNLYVADSGNRRIRRVSPQGTIETIAGVDERNILSPGSFVDGKGEEARFGEIAALVADQEGYLFVADTQNNRIRKVSPEGIVSTWAGGEGAGIADGARDAARFNRPAGLALEPTGALYVLDHDQDGSPLVRRVARDGTVSTLPKDTTVVSSHTGLPIFPRLRYERGTYRLLGPAGDVPIQSFPTSEGPSGKGFERPTYLALDADGNLYVVDDGKRIGKVSPQGEVTMLSDNPPGYRDGPLATARFESIGAIAIDPQGNLYVTDSYRVRRIDADGTVTTVAGSGESGYQDGPGMLAKFEWLRALAVDSEGTVFVSDFSDRIRKISPQGDVSRVAGSFEGYGDGAADQSRFHGPCALAFDVHGNLLVADERNERIRLITPDGRVETLAGERWGFRDGAGREALFHSPTGIACDQNGAIYVVDRGNMAIRKLMLIPTEQEPESEAQEEVLLLPKRLNRWEEMLGRRIVAVAELSDGTIRLTFEDAMIEFESADPQLFIAFYADRWHREEMVELPTLVGRTIVKLVVPYAEYAQSVSVGFFFEDGSKVWLEAELHYDGVRIT